MKVRDITLMAVLTALAVVLSYVEGFIPSIGIPGVKLGFANIMILITLYAYGWQYALGVNILRVFLASLLKGNIFQMGFLMSLTGAMLSLGIMILLKYVFKKLHIITISVIGSIFHIIGQIIIAIIMTNTVYVFYYFPVLLLVSVVTGIVVGLITDRCLKIPVFNK